MMHHKSEASSVAVASHIHSDSDPEARLSPATRRKLALSRQSPDRHYSVQKMKEGIYLVGYGGHEPRPPMYNPNLLVNTLATRLQTTRPGILWKDQGVMIHRGPTVSSAGVPDNTRGDTTRMGIRQPDKPFFWRVYKRENPTKNSQDNMDDMKKIRKSRAETHLANLERTILGDGYGGYHHHDNQDQYIFSARSSRKSMDVGSTSFMSSRASSRAHSRKGMDADKQKIVKVLNEDMPRVEEALALIEKTQKEEYIDRLNMAKDPRYKRRKAATISTESPAHSSKHRKEVMSNHGQTMEREDMIETFSEEGDMDVPMTRMSPPNKWVGHNFDSYQIGPIKRKGYIPINGALRRENTIGIDWKVSTNRSHPGNSGCLYSYTRPVTVGLNSYGTSEKKIQGKIMTPSELNVLKVLPVKLDGLLPVQMAHKVSNLLKEKDVIGSSMATESILSSDSRLGDLLSMDDLDDPDEWSAPTDPSPSKEKSLRFARGTYESSDDSYVDYE